MQRACCSHDTLISFSLQVHLTAASHPGHSEDLCLHVTDQSRSRIELNVSFLMHMHLQLELYLPDSTDM